MGLEGACCGRIYPELEEFEPPTAADLSPKDSSVDKYSTSAQDMRRNRSKCLTVCVSGMWLHPEGGVCMWPSCELLYLVPRLRMLQPTLWTIDMRF